jgi:molecular chaperone GrpE
MTDQHKDDDAHQHESVATGESPDEMIRHLTQQLAAKTEEAAQQYDRFLRERAEVENFKKRMQRERADAIRYASEGLIRELLPIIDDLERSVEAARQHDDDPLVQGVRLVLKNALDVLARHGVNRLEARGERFDPNVHEAVSEVHAPEVEPDHVVTQFLPGYRLHDRLLRPARVSVAGKPQVEMPGGDD